MEKEEFQSRESIAKEGQEEKKVEIHEDSANENVSDKINPEDAQEEEWTFKVKKEAEVIMDRVKHESIGIYRKARNSEVVTNAQERASDVIHSVRDLTVETGIKIKDKIHDLGVSAEHAAESAASKLKNGTFFVAAAISQKAKNLGHKISDSLGQNPTLTKIRKSTSESIGKVTSFVKEEYTDLKNFIQTAEQQPVEPAQQEHHVIAVDAQPHQDDKADLELQQEEMQEIQ